MQRCKLNRIFNAFYNIIGNHNGRLEFFAAVYDTVTDSDNIVF